MTIRTRQRATTVLVTVVLMVAACVPPGAEPEPEAGGAGLDVSFAPEPSDSPRAGTATDGSPPADDAPTTATSPSAAQTSTPDPTSPDPSPSDDPTSSGSTTSGGGAAAPAESAITDPSGDVEPGRIAMDPPDHADLVGAELTRAADGTFQLAVDLGGGAPDAAQDDRHTMNIASFYDVDGDGDIDYEVWANLSSSGWGTSQFDNEQGTSAYGADDDVAVEVVDGRLVLHFPASAVGDAASFRWALAAEWGTYEDLRLGTMSHDLAPDDRQPAHFPA